jgi:hypothetical protein
MKKAAIIGFVLCALGAINPLSATILTGLGGRGDYSAEARCRPSEMDYLVGFAYKSGDWMDQIQPLCARLISAAQFGKKRYLNVRGGNGGYAGEQYCHDDEVVSGIRVYLRKDVGEVQSLEVVCSSMKTWAARTLYIGPSYRTADQVPEAPLQCPYGEVASGIQVRYGQYVNAIGLICDPYKVPGPVSLPPKQVKLCNDKCAPLLKTVHPPDEADRVFHNCEALCNDRQNATITCANGTTVKGTQPCK